MAVKSEHLSRGI